MRQGMVDESEFHSVSAVAACECVIFEIERDKLEPLETKRQEILDGEPTVHTVVYLFPEQHSSLV